MATLFQLGVLLLFSVGAVQCKERSFSDNGLMIKVHEYDLQRGDEARDSCDVCKKILQKIFNIIGKGLSKGSINVALKTVCISFKVLMRPCIIFIKKYKEKLVKVIMSAQNAPDACKRLGLCKKPKI